MMAGGRRSTIEVHPIFLRLHVPSRYGVEFNGDEHMNTTGGATRISHVYVRITPQ